MTLFSPMLIMKRLDIKNNMQYKNHSQFGSQASRGAVQMIRPFMSQKSCAASKARLIQSQRTKYRSGLMWKARKQGMNLMTHATASEILDANHPDALIFDCDGVIVESEDIHRRAYNAAFEHFDVRCPDDSEGPLMWSESFYDVLQNTVGGGKPKMRWYFGKHGWPTSTILDGGKAPETDEEQIKVIDTLQDWKTEKYKDIIGSGQVSARPGIIALMDAAKEAGIPVAVCSAATKAAVVFVLQNLLGKERFEGLDLFMAGDDVPIKKPDPTIYRVAAERLNVDPARCLVIEDSTIGLEAALGAGMQCLVTTTSSTSSQDFDGAIGVLESMDGIDYTDIVSGKIHGVDFRKAKAL